MSSNFYFKEAVIFDVDPSNMTCSLMYGDLNSGEVSHGVPMPNLLGSGNAGLITNLMKGTRVIAAYLHDKARAPVAIIAVLPSLVQGQTDYNQASLNLIDKVPGTLGYPKTLRHGDTYVSAHTGPSIWLRSDNSLHISSRDGSGIFLIHNKQGRTNNIFTLSNNHSTEGSGGRLSWGRVKRSFEDVGGNSTNKFFTNINRDSELRDIGFWKSEDVSLITNSIGKRNPALSEYKLVINEFATEFGFTGLDDEILKIGNSKNAVARNPTLGRDRESTNLLRLGEGELIEIVGGNLIDINGNILDINYNPVIYSTMVPADNVKEKIEEAKLKSRRGVGYHFKLSTNINSFEKAESKNDFIFDIDKEGILKVNIPKSSTTGNIPYVTNVDFQAKNAGRVHNISSENISSTERIPVHTRNAKGEVVSRVISPIRDTGIRFLNTDDVYFPITNTSGKQTIRVNPTKHHNIYAAAERLIANQITEIQAPFAYAKDGKITGGGLSFVAPDIPTDITDYSKDSVFEVAYDGKDVPYNKTDIKNLFYSAVRVSPGPPAISTGGDTVVSGIRYSDDDPEQPIISNYFNTTTADGNPDVTVSSEGGTFTNVVTHGGVSANINLEGSIEMSVGADNVDNKSMILDTAGSLVMWLGKDKKNRSMIFQSDGDVLMNIGGSYPKSASPDDTPPMNIGRFDLRVNVVDKGFYDSGNTISSNKTKYGAGTIGDKPNSSDYTISISEHGLVIAGMKSGAPMIIRNDGPLVLESASDKVTIKGMSVEMVEFGKTPKSPKAT